jgi:hypothetical protein
MAKAVVADDIPALKALVASHPSAVSAWGSGETTPLHVAVSLRKLTAARILLESPEVDLGATSGEPDRQTAADLAVEMGYQMLIQLCKEKGVVVTVRLVASSQSQPSLLAPCCWLATRCPF